VVADPAADLVVGVSERELVGRVEGVEKELGNRRRVLGRRASDPERQPPGRAAFTKARKRRSNAGGVDAVRSG